MGNMTYDQSEIDRWAEIESEDGQASSRIGTALSSHCWQVFHWFVTELSSQCQYATFRTKHNQSSSKQVVKGTRILYARPVQPGEINDRRNTVVGGV